MAAARFYGAMAYVAAALHAVKAYAVDDMVSAVPRHFDRVAERGDAQHAPAVGDRLALGECGAGVEYVSILRGSRQPFDEIAFPRGNGVAGRGQHDAECGTPVPDRLDRLAPDLARVPPFF